MCNKGNYPSGMTDRDWKHVLGEDEADETGLSPADKDELRGEYWADSERNGD
jgi:hypothetical protein